MPQLQTRLRIAVCLSVSILVPCVACGQIESDGHTTLTRQESKPIAAEQKKTGEFAPDQSQTMRTRPEDAIVLLSKDTLRFSSKNGQTPNWKLENGELVSTRGERRSNHVVSDVHFRDADIHVEFMTNKDGNGNSGIYIQGLFEIQIFNSDPTKKQTQQDLGALYGFAPPLVAAGKPPGEWQVFDIRYIAPRKNETGRVVKKGEVTVWLNGQKIQDKTQFGEPRSKYNPYVYRSTDFLKAIQERLQATNVGPIFLQDHDNAVRFRNVWVKPLDEKLTTPASDSRPNIIVIYTDDQGYGDVSTLNPAAKFQTPNMDRIGNEGLIFTNGHSADSICTPSRYALLTGRYPWRTRRKRGVMGAEGKCLIKDGRMTLPSMLKSKGYNTAMVGKWHLGMDFPGTRKNRDWTKPIQDMPLDKGFDYYYGIPASLNYGILAWFEGRHAAVPPTLFTNKKPNARHSDYRIKPPYDESPAATKKRLNKQGWEIAPDFIDNQCLTRFTDKAIGWMKTKIDDAKAGKPFFLYLPYTSPHFPVCPLPEFQGMGDCGAYGEFLIETDHHIGRVLAFLEKNGIDKDTLIVFTSDNGPEKPWRQHIDNFDHDSRGGYREGKRSVYEGGHRVPFLVRWPNGIKSPGRTWDEPVGQVDLLATFSELVGVELPDNAGEDSDSFASVLRNSEPTHKRVPVIAHGNPECRYSIIDSNWKLVMPTNKKKAELYDLSKDKSETVNISDQHPDRVKTLTKKLNRMIAAGRSTPGAPQANDTPHWKELSWLTVDEYDRLHEQNK